MILKPYQYDIGERFGTLTIWSKVPASGRHGIRFRVGCDCGYAFAARGLDIRKGKAKCRRCSPGR